MQAYELEGIYMHYYYGPMMDGNDWGWGFLMMILWLVFFVIVAVMVLRYFKGDDTGGSSKTGPLDIAKERYAKGEITKEQYEQLVKDLK